MSDMVMAISFLHSKRLIHRSITLNAFWIQADGHLKLVDYTRCIKMHSWFRKNPKRWNTLDYVPPEMLRIGLCTKAVDMWALGVILYKMTTGRQPFYADTHTNLIRRIRQNDVECNYLFSEMAADLCRQLLQKNPKHRLGHAGDTFLCISNHPYFSRVSWDQVLNGTSKAPEITFLMSAEHHSEYKVRPLDFRTSANRATALKNKPLLLQEISTKSVTEMFNKEILDINHAFDMAKYQHEKSGFSLPIHKHTDRYSFQNITKSMTSERVAIRERSPSVSGGSKPTSDTNLKSPASQPSTPPLDAALSLMFMSLRLEGLFRTALLDFEAKVKQGVPTLIALEEFRDFITRNVDEIRASSILRHPIRNMGAVKTPLSTRPNTT